MRTARILAAVMLLASPARADDPAPDCAPDNLGSLNQQDANECAAQAYAAADKLLNVTYQRLGAERGAWYKARLRKVELTWIAYRDAECALQLASFGEGSMAPMIMSHCMTRLTEQRTELLIEALNP